MPISLARRPSRLDLVLAAGVLTPLFLFAYLPHVLDGGWYLDDWKVASSFDAASRHGRGEVVATAFELTYRPVHSLLLLVLWTIGGTGQSAALLVGVTLNWVAAILLFAVLRWVGLARSVALAATALYAVVPHIDAGRLWAAAFAIPLALALCLSGVLLSLHGLSRVTRRSHVLWHACAVLLYAAAVVCYELVAPLILLAGFAYARSGARGRPLAIRVAADVVVLGTALVVQLGKGPATTRATQGPRQWVSRVEQIVSSEWKVFSGSLPLDGVVLGPVGAIALLIAVGVLARSSRGRELLAAWAALASLASIHRCARGFCPVIDEE